VKKLSTLGVSILAVGGFFFILTGIGIAEHFRAYEYMETVCNKPGTSCPIEDPWFLIPFGVPALALIIIGSYFLAASKNRL
jgi:hypothetical protein